MQGPPPGTINLGNRMLSKTRFLCGELGPADGTNGSGTSVKLQDGRGVLPWMIDEPGRVFSATGAADDWERVLGIFDHPLRDRWEVLGFSGQAHGHLAGKPRCFIR